MACVKFGSPSILQGNVLPTYIDVMKQYNFTKHQVKKEGNQKDPPHREIAEKVTIEIESVWKRASLPTVSHERILAMLNTYHGKYRNILKSYNKNVKSNSESYKLKLSQFKDNALTPFDICTCKCRHNNECTCKK